MIFLFLLFFLFSFISPVFAQSKAFPNSTYQQLDKILSSHDLDSFSFFIKKMPLATPVLLRLAGKYLCRGFEDKCNYKFSMRLIEALEKEGIRLNLKTSYLKAFNLEKLGHYQKAKKTYESILKNFNEPFIKEILQKRIKFLGKTEEGRFRIEAHPPKTFTYQPLNLSFNYKKGKFIWDLGFDFKLKTSSPFLKTSFDKGGVYLVKVFLPDGEYLGSAIVDIYQLEVFPKNKFQFKKGVAVLFKVQTKPQIFPGLLKYKWIIKGEGREPKIIKGNNLLYTFTEKGEKNILLEIYAKDNMLIRKKITIYIAG